MILSSDICWLGRSHSSQAEDKEEFVAIWITVDMKKGVADDISVGRVHGKVKWAVQSKDVQ